MRKHWVKVGSGPGRFLTLQRWGMWKDSMPWKTSSMMDGRARFVLECEQGEHTMTELCEVYEISRQTGYYWLRQHK